MGLKYWTEYRKLFVISNFLLVTLLLCLTAFFLPYWFIVDFYPSPTNDVRRVTLANKPAVTTMVSSTPSTDAAMTPTTPSPFAPVGRRKRDVPFDFALANGFLKRRKRQAINRGKVFDDLFIPKVHVGLFYMLYPYADFMTLEIMTPRMVSLIHLEKNSPDFVVPQIMYVSQIFYCFGLMGLTLSTAAVFILACRKYSSVVGEIALSGTLMFSTLMLIAGVILAAIHREGEIWDDFPVMNTVILNRAPEVTLDWGFYFALVGPLLSVLCTVLIWTQACSTCIDVEEIRRQQMKEIIISPEVAYQPLVSDRPYKTGHDNRMLNAPDANIMKAHQDKAWEAGMEEFSI